MKPCNGILGRLPSPVNGAPIVALATGVAGTKSDNSKTGKMAQVYILVDDASALAALRDGRDEAICGDCKHRPDPETGKRTCYVQVFKSVETVSKKLRGIPVRKGVKGIPYGDGILAVGQPLRLGAYGDPGLVPYDWLRSWTNVAGRWTGYTHQWKRLDSRKHGRFLMASCDTVEEARAAEARGWRFFLVTPEGVPGPKKIGRTRLTAASAPGPPARAGSPSPSRRTALRPAPSPSEGSAMNYGAIHYIPTAARGLYIAIFRPDPERSRFGDVLGIVAKIGKDRWDAFGLNSENAADIRALGPRICTEARRYLAADVLYRLRENGVEIIPGPDGGLGYRLNPENPWAWASDTNEILENLED
jgi:hypothetical protein